ncbi:ATP-binding cassette domain-containing protein [Paenibacillus sp. SYP-B3998]|uniref:ATP-binding cassette domain-containing protein n=1 Tax=Paenibacillus sp. SYP-B3998 TaxID=2678564 RepID=A0A6G4A633_9BACL|nr:ATP-binding cassette domain-containing protein [Paenibacillus sp. SYP-B3998]NEW09281.1 ATP-binding cassette domain-containing protein [Paenibacillus sp. SYP-B3998]
MTIALGNLHICTPENPNNHLLKALNVTLHQGEITLLIGHTGSGKSTLLQVLAGILEPTSGTIQLDGQALWQKGKVERRHLLRLGLTFQFPEQQLFAGNIRREFTYSLRPYRLGAQENERRIQAACDDFDPHGIFAMQRSPFTLSGGEQRRLALATTFATSPDWLFMDEPTAGLEAAAVRELLRLIRERELSRGGLIIATHDLDTFFPLADRVIVMNRGAIVADGSPAALCREPELLVRAGVGLPSCVETAQSLARCGIAITPDRLTPELAAEAIAAALLVGVARISSGEASPHVRESAVTSARAAERLSTAVSADYAAEPLQASAEVLQPNPAAWLRLDPRAKWLLYLLLVIGTMLQQQWTGLVVAALPVALAFVGLPRLVLRGGMKIAWPFVIFMAISVGLAGLDVSTANEQFAIGFSIERAWSTMLNVSRLFIVVIAGYWLAATTPYGQLVQGLNWALRYFKKVKIPVESFALAVSLIFRFIPLILREWQRFSTIVRARGKAALRPGRVRTRDIPALVVPLLLSMFYKAEQLTIAMEMKKIDGKQLARQSDSLKWQGADGLLVAGGILCFGLLVYIRG